MPGPPQTRLDRRRPLVLDTRELGRRPGSMLRLRRSVPAPADLRLELAQVPSGSELHLDLRLESVQEGVLVTGTAEGTLTAECSRCLEPVTDVVTADLQELFVYPPARPPDGDGEELPALVGDLLDLEPAVRDAVVLALPLRPLCDPGCAGLCPDCGVRRADGPHRHPPAADPRWAGLSDLLAAPSPDHPHRAADRTRTQRTRTHQTEET